MDTIQQGQEQNIPAAGERTITITERERQFLIEMVQGEISELRSENYHAESHQTKAFLKEREECAKRLLDQLQQDRPQTAAPR